MTDHVALAQNAAVQAARDPGLPQSVRDLFDGAIGLARGAAMAQERADAAALRADTAKLEHEQAQASYKALPSDEAYADVRKAREHFERLALDATAAQESATAAVAARDEAMQSAYEAERAWSFAASWPDNVFEACRSDLRDLYALFRQCNVLADRIRDRVMEAIGRRQNTGRQTDDLHGFGTWMIRAALTASLGHEPMDHELMRYIPGQLLSDSSRDHSEFLTVLCANIENAGHALGSWHTRLPGVAWTAAKALLYQLPSESRRNVWHGVINGVGNAKDQ